MIISGVKGKKLLKSLLLNDNNHKILKQQPHQPTSAPVLLTKHRKSHPTLGLIHRGLQPQDMQLIPAHLSTNCLPSPDPNLFIPPSSISQYPLNDLPEGVVNHHIHVWVG